MTVKKVETYEELIVLYMKILLPSENCLHSTQLLYSVYINIKYLCWCKGNLFHYLM